MTDLFIDLESYSECDLRECGAYRYAEDLSTEIILLAYAFGDDEVKIWQPEIELCPPILAAALTDPRATKWAHNASFERAVIANVFEIPCPPEQWRCTMTHALTLGLPAALGQLGEVIRIAKGDAKEVALGKRLIRKFCMPNIPRGQTAGKRIMPADSPADWEQFKNYCMADVRAERAIHHKLSKWPVPEHEWKNWELDQKINDRGLPVDLNMVKAAIRVDIEETELNFTRAVTITRVSNPNSTAQMLDWFHCNGCAMPDMTKASVRAALAGEYGDPSSDVREVLMLRKKLSKSSIKKYHTLKRAVCTDGTIKGCHQFSGAGRTWRWAGRIFQPQNLTVPSFKELTALEEARHTLIAHGHDGMDMVYDDVPQVLADLVRAAIAPPHGEKLAVSDWVGIESVMLAWASGCTQLLDAFRRGRDPYIEYATKLFKIPYEAVTKQQRKFCKPPALGCGYMLGGKGLVEYAASFDVTLTEEQAQQMVDVYRESYPEIPQFWYAVDAAVRWVLENLNGKTESVGSFKFRYDKPFLFIDLPSGRSLAYVKPSIMMMETPWGAVRPTVCYWGIDGFTKQWQQISTHPGKITENIVQAISRDVLAHGLAVLNAHDLDICGHVHDEIITVYEGYDKSPHLQLEKLMSIVPSWCGDAPLRASGYTGAFYRKE